MLRASSAWMTAVLDTLQKSAILSRSLSGISFSVRHRSTSG